MLLAFGKVRNDMNHIPSCSENNVVWSTWKAQAVKYDV